METLHNKFVYLCSARDHKHFASLRNNVYKSKDTARQQMLAYTM